jgi:hypothetical protein
MSASNRQIRWIAFGLVAVALVVSFAWLYAEMARKPAVDSSAPPASRTSLGAPQSVDEVTVYITRTGRKYHTAGCRYLSKSQIPISLKDAKARGYGPCSVCNPPQ